MCNFVRFFVCTVPDFSAAEKDRGVKFCMHVGLLSGQVLSPFGELWLAGSHGAALFSGMYAEILQTRREYRRPSWVAYVDFRSAFDSIDRQSLWLLF